MTAPTADTRRPWAVVGGGAAGLAAAEALARAGEPVVLYERHSRLGGRAGSFPDPVRGGLTDNQHVWMGCCTALRGLLDRAGAGDAVFEQDRVRVPFLVRPDRDDGPVRTPGSGTVSPGGKTGRPVVLEAGGLPPPLHLLGALLRFPLLTLSERLVLLRALIRLRREAGTLKEEGLENPFGEWLDRARQSVAVREVFWSPVITSILNARPEEVRSDLAAMAVTESFLGPRRAAALGWSVVPLAELWERVAARIVSLGGEVRRGVRVDALEIDSPGQVTALRAGNERREIAGAVAAVPPGALPRLLGPEWANTDPLNRGAGLEWAPILNLHLWFAEPVTDEPLLAVTGSPLQWIFVRPAAPGYAGRDQHLDLVSSASGIWLERSPDQVRSALTHELAAVLPAVRNTPLLAAKVVHIRRATFFPGPGSQAARPPAATPIPNLALAGAWTATGWPSTLEGAARSGELAVRALGVRSG